MFNVKYPDADFDLMQVSDEELFYALRGEMFNIIKNLQVSEDIEIDDMLLDKDNATRRKAYGKDYNIYPLIVLPIRVKGYLEWKEYDLILNSFEVCLMEHKMNANIVSSKNLTRVFHEFMASRFPDSSYFEKRNNYFRTVQAIRKIEDGEVFK